MKAGEAVVTEIPLLTKTEELDCDKDTMKDIFKDDDISRLDLEFRRNRKLKVNSIEEYLNSLEFKPFEDGDCDDNCGDSSKGFFKKDYKMRIAEEPEIMSPTRDDLHNTVKKTQISSVSTKSNFKRQEETGLQFELTNRLTGNDNILNKYLKSGAKINVAAIKSGNSLAFDEKVCKAKVFTSRHKVTRVDYEEQSLPGTPSNRDCKQIAEDKVLTIEKNYQERDVLDISSIVTKLQDGASETFVISGDTQINSQFSQIFGIQTTHEELILLEFSQGEDLEGQNDLVSIHVCRPSLLLETKKPTFLERLEQSTKKDGYCSMKKFIAKLLDQPLLSSKPSTKQSFGHDNEVKSLHFAEFSYTSLDNLEAISNKKNSSSTGRKNSIADMLEDDQFFEDDSNYFQARKRERVYQVEGSFSL